MGQNEDLTAKMKAALEKRFPPPERKKPEAVKAAPVAARTEEAPDPDYFTQKEAMALLGWNPLSGALAKLNEQAQRIAETLFIYKDGRHVYTHDDMEKILAGEQELTTEGMHLDPAMAKDISAYKDYIFVLRAIESLAKEGAAQQAKYKAIKAAAEKKNAEGENKEPIPPAPLPFDIASQENFIRLGENIYPRDLFRRDFINGVVATMNERLRQEGPLGMLGETIRLDVSPKAEKSR